MNIDKRVEAAIAKALRGMGRSEVDKLNRLNDKFDSMLEKGMVIKDSYGISVHGPLTASKYSPKPVIAHSKTR